MITVQKNVTAMVGNHAVAYAVKQAKPQVLAVFPITPQTTMLEKLAEYIDNGELKAELIKVEGEHSALAAVYGAAVAGARVFTATSSQGLLYMTEMIYWVGGERVPIVNAVATRALAEPWSIWDDHQDFFSKRDASWIMMMAENVQDAYDMTLQAFRISEDKRVILPVMMGFDGFILTHTMERLE
ncbi:MAG: pyruvate ferredoxin oxidoreductase, partial [Acidianus sp.]